ncbi:L,D-transpeptidase family protein [Falsigemmobacter faecalis]|uniref:L,D-TPase catalytic domain-containing protein n=1 Tax=Falsigemmobacter faecalis TaxID=2488730 RepID=A0A3P3DNM3_9RHOB|nr:L,D-transpeptidase family protein [Falsigemmobacter faecalis]RRH75544.1 hypothetical protein EG244_08660 [Falsigemmobacter faecalis]
MTLSPFDLVVTPQGLRFMNRLHPCTVGRGGVVPAAVKREGDGASPEGMHRIVGMFYRPDRIAKPNSWAEPIRLTDLWSDDSGDEDYNQLVKAPYAPSHEKLRRGDPMYDLILVTDWNWPMALPGKGSAIFVHQWRGPCAPTAGCIGLSRRDLHRIAARIEPGSRLIIGPRHVQ